MTAILSALKTLTDGLRGAAVPAIVAAVLLPPAAAQAQWYSSVSRQPPPLYPYAVQNPHRMQADQPYAIEVAPNTYVIQRPAAAPRARSRHVNNPKAAPHEPVTSRFDRPPQKADPALIEELRKRSKNKSVIHTTKIVREKPVVIETKRYVDDPPRVIERYHVVDDTRTAAKNKKAGKIVVEDRDGAKPKGKDDGKKRVIAADAEITILGPDRMSIRLFRKSGAGRANASAD